MTFFAYDGVPDGLTSDGKMWRFDAVKDGQVTLSAGGNVVGEIPQGLPSLQVPTVQWEYVLALLPAAIVMALIGFMEATSISKAIATKTGERVDTNKELVGQGLANIAGSFFSSYTVSGSFSRSAVAARLGAKTGLFAIISALAVVLVLLFFTQYLYHLPQAVLAVIVMMAVFSLIRIKPLIQAWRVDRVGAVIGITTFVATLVMAPAIANGILLGIVLTVLHFLIRTMKPRADIVARKPDGTIGGIVANRLQPLSEYYVPVRFDGSLTFINVAYFEDIILEANADFPKAKTILVIGSGINDIDASGEEKIREVSARLRKVGVKLVFSGLKHQVRSILEQSGVVAELGQDAFYSDKETALRDLRQTYDEAGSDEKSATDRPKQPATQT
jgi:MFS superfamily sulfate permease-like transporter